MNRFLSRISTSNTANVQHFRFERRNLKSFPPQMYTRKKCLYKRKTPMEIYVRPTIPEKDIRLGR